MPKPSAISVFVAATSLLVASAPALHAQDAGGLKEWTTDQAVDEESVLAVSYTHLTLPTKA